MYIPLESPNGERRSTPDYTTAVANGNTRPAAGIDAFDSTAPAPEFTPLPPGIYSARVVRGEYTTTKTGADAYRMRFEIVEGPHEKQTVVRTWTFGEKALSYTRRDLALFGLTSKTQLLSPFPEPTREYHVRLVVCLQRGDDGIERNDIRRIDNVRIVESPASRFVLPPEQSEGGTP